jgi:hypothetical protein
LETLNPEDCRDFATGTKKPGGARAYRAYSQCVET